MLPTSRVEGNMSGSLWYDASHLGLVTPEVVDTVKAIHASSSNGPEFDVFLTELERPLDDMPQGYRRHVKKYRHSEYY
jgi:hypothetical protein